ncbi:hypothetical protein YB2330_004419 [Saitoella coloradoensis]
MTSLPPRPDYTPSELSVLYPPSLRLIHLQVLARHGERTPVRARLQNAGVPEHWNLCHAAKRFRASVLLPEGSIPGAMRSDEVWDEGMRYSRRVETFDRNGKAVIADVGEEGGKGVCILGELTDEGRISTLALGMRLRRLYVDALGFLPEKLEKEAQIYLRSTPMQRTLESLHQVFTGLYPPTARGPGFEATFTTRNFTEENLYPNEGACKRLNDLSRQFAELAAEKWNPILAGYTSERVRKFLPDGVAVDGHPRVSGLLDTVNSSLGNGIKLPAELTDERVHGELEAAAVTEWFAGYLQNEQYRRLGAGRLLGDLKDRMVTATKEEKKGGVEQKVCLYSAHDTTLGAVLASLGCFDGRWPPYTSSIAFELFSKAPSEASSHGWLTRFFGGVKEEHYVRLRYNEKPMTLPGCAPQGKHLAGDASLCTLDAFREVVESMVPADWMGECDAGPKEASAQTGKNL